MLLQCVPGSVLTLGEEIGWRGYLQKKLTDRHGRAKGVILLGLVWGYWHLPIVLMGYNFPSQPVLGGLLLMPLGSVCIGLFLSWLYLRSRSVWLPTLGHTSVNLSAGLLYAGMTARGDQVVIPLVFIAVWAVVGAICLASIRGAHHGDSEQERTAVVRVRPPANGVSNADLKPENQQAEVQKLSGGFLRARGRRPAGCLPSCRYWRAIVIWPLVNGPVHEFVPL